MTELSTIDNAVPLQALPTAPHISATSLVLDERTVDSAMRIAELMASGRTTIPKHLQGSPGDCLAITLQAIQWGMNPFAVAQKTHLVNGTLGYEAQLVIAMLNSSPALATRLNWEWYGDWANVNGKTDKSAARGVRVWATLRGETQPRILEVSMAQVGDVRNSPNWVADPRQQIGYLTAKRWARLHAPDVLLGVYTPDELEEMVVLPPRTAAQIGQAAVPTAERTDVHEKLIESLEMVAFNHGGAELAKAWGGLSKDDRIAIGTAELDRLKKIAAEADETIAAAKAAEAEAAAMPDAQR